MSIMLSDATIRACTCKLHNVSCKLTSIGSTHTKHTLVTGTGTELRSEIEFRQIVHVDLYESRQSISQSETQS